MRRRRSFWGWGYDEERPGPEEERRLVALIESAFGGDRIHRLQPPRISELALPEPRIDPPGELAEAFSADPWERAGHTYGKSFRDVVRALMRDFANPPDLVAIPDTEEQLARILDWCAANRIAAVPYGGGSSVVGGVEMPPRDQVRAAISIDLRRMCKTLEVDDLSLAARFQAGILGPALENDLRPHGLSLRHYPQSFEHSTLGGWLATRSAGHFATLHTHIDDFVESLRVVTPGGAIETRRLPGSGAGPSPDRLFLGSEGILGVITEAWLRVQRRPRYRAAAAVSFADFERGAEAVRVVGQSGLYPANCRLLDPAEAALAGAGRGDRAVLLLAFESADHPVDAWIARALEICGDHGGRWRPQAGRTEDPGDAPQADAADAAGAWRRSFLRGPYLRDLLVTMGMITETFETAATWDRFPTLHQAVTEQVGEALRRVCGGGVLTCRLTHVYPDGAAPYYTVIAPSAPGSQLAQWAEVKTAAADAILAAGGTITHHHAVGRDHRPWYDRQRPEGFASALRAAKRALDPRGILNPGVLIDP